MLRYKTKLDLA